MTALYTALLEGESKEALARMVCDLRDEIARLRAELVEERRNKPTPQVQAAMEGKLGWHCVQCSTPGVCTILGRCVARPKS